jgi:hypothetical protein
MRARFLGWSTRICPKERILEARDSVGQDHPGLERPHDAKQVMIKFVLLAAKPKESQAGRLSGPVGLEPLTLPESQPLTLESSRPLEEQFFGNTASLGP